MDFDKVDIGAISYQFYEIIITGAIEILKHENNFKNDEGLEISEIWTSDMRKYKT